MSSCGNGCEFLLVSQEEKCADLLVHKRVRNPGVSNATNLVSVSYYTLRRR